MCIFYLFAGQFSKREVSHGRHNKSKVCKQDLLTDHTLFVCVSLRFVNYIDRSNFCLSSTNGTFGYSLFNTLINRSAPIKRKKEVLFTVW